MKQALHILVRFRGFLITLAVVAIFGYTAHLLGQIVNAVPDQAYLDKQKQGAPTTKIDLKAIQSVQQLQPVNTTPPPGGAGKGDPFTP